MLYHVTKMDSLSLRKRVEITKSEVEFFILTIYSNTIKLQPHILEKSNALPDKLKTVKLLQRSFDMHK